MREEIIAGIKNAMTRGQSLELAAQSLVNAGYNPQEVKAAVQTISTGASNIVYSRSSESAGSKGSAPQAPVDPTPASKEIEKPPLPQLPKTGIKQKGSRKMGIIIFMVFLLVVFISAIGYLIYYLAT